MSEEKSFEQLSKETRNSLLSELWNFLNSNKKWWLLPIILTLLGLGILVMLGSSILVPFIYPLF